jgi:hypothetical protein
MRVIKWEEERAAKKAKERAYLAGELPTRKVRRKSRDPRELAVIAKMVSEKIRAEPIRVKDDGKFVVPGVTPEEESGT